MPDQIYTPVAKCAQLPTPMLQNLVEPLPTKMDAIIAAKGKQVSINAQSFGIGCLILMCLHTFGHSVCSASIENP